MMHPYFKDFFEKEHLIVTKNDMDFDFDRKEKWTLENVKKMIIKEVNEVNKD